MDIKTLVESHKTSYEIINNLIGGNNSVCVMLKLSAPQWSEVTSLIQKEDLVEGEKGIEDEVHVTIVYGSYAGNLLDFELFMANEFTSSVNNMHRKVIKTKSLDYFSNDSSDILKFCLEGNSIESFLGQLREEVLQRFNIIPTYQEYKPHITVAYLKPGAGDFYVNLYKVFGPTQFFEITGVKFSVKQNV